MNTRFLHSPSAERLYTGVAALPIIDYHCHLSPQELYEDRPFSDLWQLWLSADHYKWRLMRCCGIPEKYITGDAAPYEKYEKFAEAIAQAPGNPLYHWVTMELEQVFDIHEPLCPETARKIWDRADAYIRRTALSPRKLLERFRVAYIATTDEIAEPLTYHEKLRGDPDFSVRVCPTFRMDTLILSLLSGDRDYFKRLSAAAGVGITDGATLLEALKVRMDAFRDLDGTLADVGVAYFPDHACDDAQANAYMAQVLQGSPLEEQAFLELLGWLYLSVFPLLRDRGMVLQLHLGVMRNASTRLFETVGPDAGGDCIGTPVTVKALRWLLDTLERGDGLPRTIIYTLFPDCEGIASLIGAFPGVTLGAAWWFCDHANGIRKQLEAYSTLSALGTFTGMLTDSRSFLSYVRHDYFRRILADFLGEMVEHGEFPPEQARKLMHRICYDNPRALSVSHLSGIWEALEYEE